MLKAYKHLFFIVFLVLLAGCQSVVRTDIETFRDDRASVQKGTIRVVPVDDQIPETLEFRHFKQKLEKRLSAIGYEPVNEKDADFVARLGYGVSRQERDKPGSRVYLSGHFGYHGYYSHTGAIFSDSLGPEFEYVREVTIAIDKAPADDGAAKIVQVQAMSVGRCGHLTVVYDEILEAIFQNLMRPDGSIDRVKVKGSSNCS